MAHNRFVPSHVSAKVGQIVVWTNDDSVAHTVSARSGAGFGSRPLSRHGTYTYRVSAPGLIRYVSATPAGMTGTIAVER
jgi:VCBS repeat-containing protein